MSFVLPCFWVVVIIQYVKYGVLSGISAGAEMSQNDTIVLNAYINISKYVNVLKINCQFL